MLPGDRFDERWLASDLDEFLSSVSILEQRSDVPRTHLLLERQADGVLQHMSASEHEKYRTVVSYVDTLEPNRYVRNKGHIRPELGGDLPFVDVIREAVGDDVVGEVVHVILRAGLRPCARVAGHPEHRGLATEVWHQRPDAQLCGRGVTSGIGDPRGFGDVSARDQLR